MIKLTNILQEIEFKNHFFKAELLENHPQYIMYDLNAIGTNIWVAGYAASGDNIRIPLHLSDPQEQDILSIFEKKNIFKIEYGNYDANVYIPYNLIKFESDEHPNKLK